MGVIHLKLVKTELRIGLKRPIKLLHITDTHMTLVDERDDERKQALGKSRKKAFHDEADSVRRYLEEQLRYAADNGELVVHTGDLIDFVSKANVDFARQLLRDENIFFIAGNHEYSQYVGEAWEDPAYRMNSYMHMGYGLGVPMFFNSRIVGDGTPKPPPICI